MTDIIISKYEHQMAGNRSLHHYKSTIFIFEDEGFMSRGYQSVQRF